MKWLLLSFVVATNAWGFNKDFTLVNDRAPLEFKLMFESMKYTLKEANEQVRLIVLAQHINRGLGPLKKDQSFFLLKSEIYKALLEWPHPPSQFQVGSHTLERLKSNLQSNSSIYTPYSKWVLEALMADLETFKAEGMLDMTTSQRSSLQGEKAQKYAKMQRVLKYTRGWLEQADTLSAKDFNNLTEQLAWRTFERVKEKAALFRRFSSKAIQDSQENTFNIPEQGMPQVTPAAQGGAPTKAANPEKGIAEKASEEKSEAQETIGKIDVSPSDLPVDELSGAIDSIEEDANGGSAPSNSTPQKPQMSPSGVGRPATTPSELE